MHCMQLNDSKQREKQIKREKKTWRESKYMYRIHAELNEEAPHYIKCSQVCAMRRLINRYCYLCHHWKYAACMWADGTMQPQSHTHNAAHKYWAVRFFLPLNCWFKRHKYRLLSMFISISCQSCFQSECLIRASNNSAPNTSSNAIHVISCPIEPRINNIAPANKCALKLFLLCFLVFGPRNDFHDMASL